MQLRNLTAASIAFTGMAMAFTATPAHAAGQGAADSIIEIAYDDLGFEGNTFTFTAPSGCTSTPDDIDFSTSHLGFGTEIHSYRTFSNCWAKHYELPNFEGRSVGWGWGGDLPFVPQSIQWT